LDGVTDSMDMSLSKLRELVKDREAWPPGVQVAKESDIAERCAQGSSSSSALHVSFAPLLPNAEHPTTF